MRVRLEEDGTAFEFERKPMPAPRFRALCLLAAAGIYVHLVVAVATLCGVLGVAAVGFVTLVAAAFAAS